MRKIILIIALLFGVMSYGQTPNLILQKRLDTLSEKQKKMEKQLCELEKGKKCKALKKNCLTANGPDLTESKTQIKYGTPLCIEVSGVNTFLMNTDATYTPINFDFSTKGFLDIQIPKPDSLLSVPTGNNKHKFEKSINVQELNEKIIQNSQKFKDEFIIFQNHFSNIDKYTALKNTLLEQIKKDSIFIGDVKNFKARSTSSYNAVYGVDTAPLLQKTKIVEELTNLETSYLKLVSIYQQLNTSYKNKELKLSGELKDGNNILKFKNITASFETKYLFEDEMKKVKVINDSLIQSKNRTKIIEESQAGIDLYDEIYNSEFKTKIISKNIYDDKAEITPQLKNSKGKVMYEYPMVKVSSYGNLKINGSAGYFLNFISDDNYQLRKKIDLDATSKAGISESNTNVLKHSLGGLLHAYYNFEGNVDAGFSAGLSISDDANAGFYLGTSAFFTESNRLVLTTGVSFIKVKRLNTSNLALNTTTGNYDFSNQTDTEIRYDDVYKPSFFIGITYNLFSK